MQRQNNLFDYGFPLKRGRSEMVSTETKENPKHIFVKIIVTALRDGRSGVRSPVGVWYLSLVQIGPVAHSRDTIGGGGVLG
jgi:hypothetical protein